jgi:hypothetical protein
LQSNLKNPPKKEKAKIILWQGFCYFPLPLPQPPKKCGITLEKLVFQMLNVFFERKNINFCEMKKLIEEKQNQNTIFSDPTHGSQIHLETFLFLQMFSLLVNITMSLVFLFCFVFLGFLHNFVQ